MPLVNLFRRSDESCRLTASQLAAVAPVLIAGRAMIALVSRKGLKRGQGKEVYLRKPRLSLQL